MSVKQKFNTLEKNIWYSCDFCGNFPWFWLIFCYPDPIHETDTAGQNETDLNRSGSETLPWRNKNFSKRICDEPRLVPIPLIVGPGDLLLPGEVDPSHQLIIHHCSSETKQLNLNEIRKQVNEVNWNKY